MTEFGGREIIWSRGDKRVIIALYPVVPFPVVQKTLVRVVRWKFYVAHTDRIRMLVIVFIEFQSDLENTAWFVPARIMDRLGFGMKNTERDPFPLYYYN